MSRRTGAVHEKLGAPEREHADPGVAKAKVATSDSDAGAVKALTSTVGASSFVAPINGTFNNDFLNGTTGADTILGRAGRDQIDGKEGDDTLDGGDQNDILTGGAGNDILYGGEGTDSLSGGNDNDELYGGAGDDSLNGGLGDDLLDGGDGSDTVPLNFAGFATGISWVFANGPIQTSDGLKTLVNIERFSITGTNYADDITGGAYADGLSGQDGNDVLNGLGGNDTIHGGNGNDTLDGGEGDDRLHGGAGDDLMNGGNGDDWLQAQAGHDILNGGAGIDMADLGFITFSTALNYTLGDSVLNYTGGSITLSSMERINIGGSSGIDTITGGGYEDSIWGNAGNDFLYGLGGNDQINGDGGDDTVEGGDGSDVLMGGIGNDILRGGNDDDFFYYPQAGLVQPESGNDTWNGGAGIDKVELFFFISGQTSGVNFTLGDVTVATYYGTKTLVSIEAVNASGTNFADNLTGGIGDDEFEGLGGNDTLNGLGGNDRFDGGDGSDTFNGGAGVDSAVLDFYNFTTAVTFAVGNQTVSTSRGQKTLNSIEAVILTGGSGDDVLSGGDYNDEISGGAGSDTLNGGGGDDILDGFSSGTTADRLIGGAGNDRLKGYSNTNTIAVFTGPRSNYTVTLDGNGYVIVTDNVGTDGTDTLEFIRTLEFSDGIYTAEEATGHAPLVLSGSVWNDLNRDSAFLAGETGLSGVSLSLFKDDGDGVFGAGDILVGGTTTGAGGTYAFSGLDAGSYIVRVDEANFDAGGVLDGMISSPGGNDPDDDVDNDDNGVPDAGFVVSRAVTLAAGTEPSGDTNDTLDFGFVFQINSAPVNSLGGTIGTGEDAIDAWLSGMSISDPEADAATDDVQVTFAVEHGTLDIRTDVVGGITAGDIVGDDTGTITVIATLNQINATLAATNGLTYSPDANFNGDDSLTVTSNDLGHNGLDPGLSGNGTSEEDVDVRTISVSAVNDAVNTTAPATMSVTVNGAGQAVTGLSIGDVDATLAPAGVYDVTLSATHGTLTLTTITGLTFTTGDGSDDSVMTFHGVLADLNAALATAQFTPDSDYIGSAQIQLLATDTFGGIVATGSGAATNDSDTIEVTVERNGTSSDDVLTGTPDADTFMLQQGGNDTAYGLAGDDGFYFGAALTGADIVDGGDGVDDQVGLQGDYSGGVTLNAANFAGIETFSLLPGNITTYGDSGTNFYDYNIATTGSFGRNITVNGNRLRAGEDFTFDGSAELTGSFTFYGGFGVEDLTGGAGDDGFYFGPDGRFGAGDAVDGGGGTDNQLGLRGDYNIDFNAPGFAGALANIQTIALLSDMDPLFTPIGDGEFDYSITLSDAMLGAGQQLTVSGVGLGATENLIVNGSAETNGSLRLIGGGSNDVLTGGALADTIFGGLRGDTLTGGAGADQFVYTNVAQSNSAERDGIQDFVSGTDKLNLSGIDANTAVAGDQAFSFVGQSQFTGTAGELRMENISLGGPIWMAQGDTNGDGVSDLEVVIVLGQGSLAATDFVL